MESPHKPQKPTCVCVCVCVCVWERERERELIRNIAMILLNTAVICHTSGKNEQQLENAANVWHAQNRIWYLENSNQFNSFFHIVQNADADRSAVGHSDVFFCNIIDSKVNSLSTNLNHL